MAAQTTADLLVQRLIDWNVDTIFGLPGDGINGVMEALRKRQDEVRFIHVRHEEAAAFMACGYAKFTGRLGVCLATSGPRGIHLLNGLYDAKLDRQPVLAITGMAFRPGAYIHPAGRRAGQAVHGCRRLQPARHGQGAHGELGGPRRARRAGVQGRCTPDDSHRRPGDGDRRAIEAQQATAYVRRGAGQCRTKRACDARPRS